jgi:hypothetical protein
LSELPTEFAAAEAPWKGTDTGYGDSDYNGEQNFQGPESSLEGGSSSSDEEDMHGRSLEDFLEWPLELLLQSKEQHALPKRKRRRPARETSNKCTDDGDEERRGPAGSEAGELQGVEGGGAGVPDVETGFGGVGDGTGGVEEHQAGNGDGLGGCGDRLGGLKATRVLGGAGRHWAGRGMM